MSRWPVERASGVGLGLSLQGLSLGWRSGADGGLRFVHEAWDASSAPRARDDWIAAVDRLATTAASVSGGPARARVAACLAPDTVRWFSLAVSPGVRALGELRQLARLRFEEIHGMPADGWRIEGDWHRAGEVVCMAVPLPLAQAIDALREGGALRGWRIGQALPAALALQRRARPAAPLVIVALGDSVTMIWSRDGRCRRIDALRVDEHDPWPTVHQELLRIEASGAFGDAAGATRACAWLSTSARPLPDRPSDDWRVERLTLPWGAQCDGRAALALDAAAAGACE